MSGRDFQPIWFRPKYPSYSQPCFWNRFFFSCCVERGGDICMYTKGAGICCSSFLSSQKENRFRMGVFHFFGPPLVHGVVDRQNIKKKKDPKSKLKQTMKKGRNWEIEEEKPWIPQLSDRGRNRLWSIIGMKPNVTKGSFFSYLLSQGRHGKLQNFHHHSQTMGWRLISL